MLYVPRSCQNLLSISALTRDNNVAITFYHNLVTIQDLKTRKVLIQGRSSDGLYPIPLAKLDGALRPQVYSATLPTWHHRLGHANLETVKRVLRQNNLAFSNKRFPAICPNCCSRKMHKLHFLVFYYRTDGPLDLICSDIWRPSPVDSVDNQKYYILFL
ncbi:Retrovirus-related Pol polyprotein from transposon RE2 [Linum perenne]